MTCFVFNERVQSLACGLEIMSNDHPVLVKYAQLEGKKATDSYTLSIQSNLSINDKLGD